MNAGCLRPIRIVIPEGSMLQPRYPAAVVAGNVEVVAGGDRRPVRGLRRARLRRRATMNNLTFGNDALSILRDDLLGRARPGQASTARPACMSHMTNSRLTDPEVLESRFPVVLEDFHIRRGSGGRGRWNAGDGTLRRLSFRERMDCAILAACRKVRPSAARAGNPANSGATRAAARRRHGDACAAATRRCWRPARRSRSSRRPAAAGESDDPAA